jgi:hypothetical protein
MATFLRLICRGRTFALPFEAEHFKAGNGLNAGHASNLHRKAPKVRLRRKALLIDVSRSDEVEPGDNRRDGHIDIGPVIGERQYELQGVVDHVWFYRELDGGDGWVCACEDTLENKPLRCHRLGRITKLRTDNVAGNIAPKLVRQCTPNESVAEVAIELGDKHRKGQKRRDVGGTEVAPSRHATSATLFQPITVEIEVKRYRRNLRHRMRVMNIL